MGKPRMLLCLLLCSSVSLRNQAAGSNVQAKVFDLQVFLDPVPGTLTIEPRGGDPTEGSDLDIFFLLEGSVCRGSRYEDRFHSAALSALIS